MKIRCRCNHLIVDQTDALPHKAHLLDDVHWHPFWDAVDAAIERSGPSARDKADACMHVRRVHRFKVVYECPNCGRWLVDGPEGMRSFLPEDTAPATPPDPKSAESE